MAASRYRPTTTPSPSSCTGHGRIGSFMIPPPPAGVFLHNLQADDMGVVRIITAAEKDHKLTTQYPRKIKLTGWLLRPMGVEGGTDGGVCGGLEMQGLIPAVLAATLLTAGVAAGAECPGNPDAIGTSRTIVVDPV